MKRFTDGVKFGVEESTEISTLSALSVHGWGVGTQKLKILPKFRHMSGKGVYLGDLYKIFTVCRQLHAPSCIKNLGFAGGVRELWGFQFRGVRINQNFQSPLPSDEAMRRR